MKKGTIDTRRNCPSCFRLKEIPTPLPVCRTCIQLIPNKLQSELATAILAGDQKAVLRVTGQVVTAAWSALDEKKKSHAVAVAEGRAS